MMALHSRSDKQPSQQTLYQQIGWLIVLAVIAGLVFPMSRSLAGAQDGDGVLTSLISTQKLTWYFWGQDRLANLLPALASPIHDLEMNLRFQIFLRSFFSFLSPIGVFLLLARNDRNIFFAAIVASLFLGISLRGYGLYNLYIQHNPFSVSLVMFALSAGALSGLRPMFGFPLAVLAAFIAYITNLALVIFVLPFIVLCGLFNAQPQRAFFIKFFVVQIVMAALAYLHATVYGEHVTSFSLNPSISAIVTGWETFSTHVRVWLLAGLFVGASVAAKMLRDRAAMLAWLVAAGMPLAVCAISCLSWLQMNSFDVRYYLLFVIVFVSCCSYLLTALLMRHLAVRPLNQRVIGLGIIAAIFAGCLGGLSETPGELISNRWRAQAQAAAEVALREHAVMITGDFWDVWPAVFVTRERLRKQGHAEADLYGVAYRGHVLRKRIMRLIRERGEVTAVCFQDNVDDCIRTTNMFVTGQEPVRYLHGTVRPVDLAGRKGVIYKITSKPPPPTDYLEYCLEAIPLIGLTPHQVGQFHDNVLDNAGQRGFLMFGPYASIPSGRYRLDLFGKTVKAAGAWVDVVSGGGTLQYARQQLTPDEEGIIASVVTDVSAPVGDLEVRVWVEASNSVQLRGYRLIPIETDKPQCHLEFDHTQKTMPSSKSPG